MTSRRARRRRWTTAFAGVVCALWLAPLGGSPAGGSPAAAAKATLSLAIVGNHFVDGSGHTIRLLGVNHPSSEYGCVDGFGYDDGHFDNADAAAVASWGVNAVRIPLNEDCWLGINGQPNSNEGADPPLSQAGYQQEVRDYVADLNAHGIYAILDLHWTAPGAQVALEQQPMPDQDHSPAFWTSVASTFAHNPAVAFDLFNEPYDPTDPRSGVDQDPNDKVSWNCWSTGTTNGPDGGAPCYTSAYDENQTKTSTYRVAGLQTLLDAIRHAGATQPVLAGGLDYANDLGTNDKGKAWMNHAPDDPRNQEAASFHNYMGQACDKAACWNHTIAPVAKHVPVVTGEFDEDDFDEPHCHNSTPSTFDADYMRWADSAGVSYLAWGWIVEPKDEQDADGCSAYSLIDDYTHYTPAKPNGVAVHDHLRALASGAKPPVALTAFSESTNSANKSIRFTLRSAQTCRGSLTGTTAHSYGAAKHKPHKVSLGTAHVALTANRSKSIALTLSTAARKLLTSKRSLATRISITLTSAGHRRTVIHRKVTLKAFKPHH